VQNLWGRIDHEASYIFLTMPFLLYPFYYSFNCSKNISSIYNMPGVFLGTEKTAINKTLKEPN
jgi:hypothetical protein